MSGNGALAISSENELSKISWEDGIWKIIILCVELDFSASKAHAPKVSPGKGAAGKSIKAEIGQVLRVSAPSCSQV